MICMEIEGDLCELERLISRVVPNASAPLTRWRKRLEILLERDDLMPAERQQLTGIIERIVELEHATGTRWCNA